MSSLSLYSPPVEKNVNKYERLGYIVNGDDRGDMGGDDGGGRLYISGGDGDERVDISVDDVRHCFRSQ